MGSRVSTRFDIRGPWNGFRAARSKLRVNIMTTVSIQYCQMNVVVLGHGADHMVFDTPVRLAKDFVHPLGSIVVFSPSYCL